MAAPRWRDGRRPGRTWAGRRQHRRASIAHLLRTEEYFAVEMLCEIGIVELWEVPVFPDSEDPLVKKRQWERSIQEWRFTMKGLAARLLSMSCL